MQDIKCFCSDPALYSIAITNIRSGKTKVVDYCTRCMPKILVADMERMN